ncbi:hypothetical protein [Bifidobacterium apri]|uniref:Uncharacterized protein n=1 Tax=Bifidobacterium apri TaxID=1769423 RepID=A0A6A2V6N8_9BIFI|nr:hypothetical protein [Bifidobacterium apri]KAB8292706.1 hypothetical protein DSM100238_1791 [Bifidobacterium apri]
MKTLQEIAEETGTTVEMAKVAKDFAEKSVDTFGGTYSKWFVCAVGYGHWGDRYSHAEGHGATRDEAVIDALTKKPWMFK